ncbi:hypothetical protein ACPCG0_13145 [Propionibacteriaceae bacterium Y1923]|uniref:hypothetical protein n=1 Tax=Aestuariimicrobium sp. Y1814 TaxID=3418742 RepID=UPI003C14AF4D
MSALTALVLLAACQPGSGATTPPPSISPILPTAVPSTTTATTTSTTPTPSPSPTDNPSPTSTLVVTARPTTPEETAALTAEAEWVYREQQRLIDEYESQGGAAELPEPLKAFVSGEYASTLEAVLKASHEQPGHFEGRTIITRVAVVHTNLADSALIGIQFCDDQSGIVHVDESGKRTPLQFRIINLAEFERGPDGRLRMFTNAATEVETCAS